MQIECYAQRLLNPFRGTLQVIRYAAAEAVSLDGVNWDIYVANESLLEGLAPSAHAQVSDIRYGNWSQARGLRRGPLYPSEDFRRMEALGDVVYGALRQWHTRVPFELSDHDEYWLLDAQARPLALLHSALDALATNAPAALWKPGIAAHERFLSRCCPAGSSAADHLSDYINGLAGDRPEARWYRREADGSGIDLASGNRRPAEDFPILCLRAVGHDADAAGLVADYLAWLAAWLLCLPDLATEQRQVLETQARAQAEIVDSLYRLYPEIIDAEAIQAARVEARLAHSLASTASDAEAPSTFYIKLNPQGGGYT
jgi:hypothetical protein